MPVPPWKIDFYQKRELKYPFFIEGFKVFQIGGTIHLKLIIFL